MPILAIADQRFESQPGYQNDLNREEFEDKTLTGEPEIEETQHSEPQLTPQQEG